METANALPQVEAAGISTNIPLRAEAIISNFGMGDRALLSKQPPTSDPQVRFDTATADYFRAMGIRLVRGRLSAASAEPSPIKEAIVNERFVQEFLKEEIDPIGVRLEVFGQPIEIRGIAADTYFSSPYEEPIPEVSLSALQNDLWAGQYLTLETRADRQRDSSESE